MTNREIDNKLDALNSICGILNELSEEERYKFISSMRSPNREELDALARYNAKKYRKVKCPER